MTEQPSMDGNKGATVGRENPSMLKSEETVLPNMTRPTVKMVDNFSQHPLNGVSK